MTRFKVRKTTVIVFKVIFYICLIITGVNLTRACVKIIKSDVISRSTLDYMCHEAVVAVALISAWLTVKLYELLPLNRKERKMMPKLEGFLLDVASTFVSIIDVFIIAVFLIGCYSNKQLKQFSNYDRIVNTDLRNNSIESVMCKDDMKLINKLLSLKSVDIILQEFYLDGGNIYIDRGDEYLWSLFIDGATDIKADASVWENNVSGITDTGKFKICSDKAHLDAELENICIYVKGENDTDTQVYLILHELGHYLQAKASANGVDYSRSIFDGDLVGYNGTNINKYGAFIEYVNMSDEYEAESYAMYALDEMQDGQIDIAVSIPRVINELMVNNRYCKRSLNAIATEYKQLDLLGIRSYAWPAFNSVEILISNYKKVRL